MTQTPTTTEELKHLASSENDNELTRRLARECLASREAQPVGFDVLADAVKEVTGGIRMEFTPGTYKGHQSVPFMNFTSLSRIVEMFRTAPPAPAVPDEMTGNGLLSMHDCGYIEGWNACRAAMLAQPVSGGYKLPPHAYRELVNSLRDTAVKYSGTDQLRERLNTVLSQFIEPDHPHTRTTEPDRN
ncbi:MAG: hypothetical protein E7G96_13665 [Serratia liquefaciens]|nr:hypothetical protein [Serratia liquefaciens]